MKHSRRLAGLAALVGLWSCGNGEGVADVLLVASVEVTPSSGSLVLGGTAQLTATAKTASGLVVPGRAVAWSSSNAAAVSVAQDGTITANALGGPVRITATVAGVSGDAQITVQPFPIARIEIAPQTTGVLVGGSTNLVATAYDAQGQPLPDRIPFWTSSAPTIAAVTSTGIVLGMAEGGPVTITATAEGKTGTASVMVAPRPATQLGFVQEPGAATAGRPISPAVRVAVRNDQGGTVTKATNQVTLALGANSGGATLGGTTTVAAVNGIATFANLTLDKAGAGYTLVATSGSLASATSTSFSNVAGAASQLTFTTPPPGSATSGQPLAPQPVLQLRDAFGNAVGQAGVTVAVAVNSGSATLGGSTTATTSAAGTATFANLSLTGSGNVTLSFSATGLTSAVSSTIAVTSAGPGGLAIVTQPSAAAQSGVPFSVQPAVQLRDAGGAPVNTAGVAITASLASGPAGGAISGGTVAQTAAGGTATFTNLAIIGPTGSYTIQFSSPGLSPVTSATILVGAAPPGPATQLTITTQPSSTATSGTPFAQQPVLQLRDASGNPVSQSGVTVTAAIASGGGTLGGTTTGTTNASGVASFTNLSITGSAGSRTLGFSATGLTGATSTPVTIGAVAASQLTITTQPSSSAVSGTAFAQQPVVQLRDAAGNPVSQSGVTVTAAIASGGGTLGGTTSATTNASGAASFTDLSITGSAGTRTLSFSSTGLTGATSAAISITAAPPSPATQLSVTTQPSSSAVSGTAFAQQPVLQLRDAGGNPVSQSGVTVTAAIASGGGTLGGTATATTNASGVASFTDLSITGSAGNRTLSFSSGGLTGATSAAISITAAPSAATQLSISTQPSSSPASGVPFNTQPSIQLRNAQGVAVNQSGVPVTVSLESGTATLSGTLTVNTNSNGRATFSGLTLSGKVGAHTLRFSSPGLTDVVSATINLAAGAATKLVIVTEPSSTARSGQELNTQPVVRLLDAFDNPVLKSGVTVTATLNSGLGTLRGDRTENTNGQGVSDFDDLEIVGVGNFTILFSATGLTPVVSATITVSP